MESEIDSRGYSIYDPARGYDWVPKIIRDKRKREREEYMNKSEQRRQELCKIIEEVKVGVKPVLEKIVRKYDAELTSGHLNHFMSCLLQPISRHFGGID